MKRREALKKSSMGLASIATLGQFPVDLFSKDLKGSGGNRKINLFSKHLQWVGYDEMAKITADIGFDGLDLTVRPKGHVEPANVERDLPKAVEACNRHGVEVQMMTTAIKDADDPNTEKIIKTAASLGIKVYRLGSYKFDFAKSIPENLTLVGIEMQKIGELNAKYSIIGDYQNHAGINVGSAVWDIYEILKTAQPKNIGAQFDVRHAMAEGIKSWSLGLRLLAPYIHSIDIKDFEYVKTDKGWNIANVPLGQGAVDFKSYFELLNELKIDVPISLHLEYPLGGANHGDTEITIPREKVIEAMVRDLKYLKSVM